MTRAMAALDAILERSADDDTSDALADTPAEPVLGYERVYRPSRRQTWSIVVSHDGMLRLLLLGLLNVPIEHFWSFPFALASVSVIDLGGATPRLRAHNLAEHIVAIDPPRPR